MKQLIKELPMKYKGRAIVVTEIEYEIDECTPKYGTVIFVSENYDEAEEKYYDYLQINSSTILEDYTREDIETIGYLL